MAVAVRKSRWRSICSDDDDVNVDDDKKKGGHRTWKRKNSWKLHTTQKNDDERVNIVLTWQRHESHISNDSTSIVSTCLYQFSRVYYQRDDDEKIVINSDGKSS